MTKTLHFTLGDKFGQTITTIAQEHIQYNYDLQHGIDVIEKGLIGIPREMVLDVITGDKIIMIEHGECVVTKRHKRHDILGYTKYHPSKWVDNEVDRLVKSGNDLTETLKLWINDLKYNKHTFNIDFDSSTLMKYIFNGDDSEILIKIEDEMGSYRQLQMIFDSYMNKANTVLNCISDLYKLSKTEECKGKSKWVIGIPPRLQVILTIKTQIKELVAITKENKKVGDTILDKYLSAQCVIDEVEESGIKTVNISDNYNAIWLSPEGDSYGLNGEIANLLHNQIGDMLVESSILTIEEDEQVDGYMMENGWLKIHDGQILGDHVYNQLTITEVQRTQLVKYATVQPDMIIYMNHDKQFISKPWLEMISLELLTDMLDYGMRKEGVKYKPSIRNIRNNPNFK
ncbi:MAG: hypothetical protein ACC656_00040 [Candidatus Heimdallarchaeota archaeon]